ncbi:MAG TPA: phospholipase D-like domain-containing protein [Bryobacteraceae bacterium]|nr:phospholipase D-like domain-containing protein [Bryobacteraceae bacterium]
MNKLLVQPGDGVLPLVKAINAAKSSVEIVIFRFNRKEVEKALANAVNRGINVHALIAHTNRRGEESLRALEMRMLAAGVSVARTADDLVRYHSKFMIIDRKELFLLSFNFTFLDIEKSRSFAYVTTSPKLVQEACKLFDADIKRQPYEAGDPNFVVSPVNARKELTSLIAGARKQLLIYDLRISDPAMTHLLQQRAKAGVDVRLIGALPHAQGFFPVRKIDQLRLHTRAIVRDRKLAFIGSQSLRELELDNRREVGVIFKDPKLVKRLADTFQQDWDSADKAKEQEAGGNVDPTAKMAKKVAKAVAKDLVAVGPVMDTIMNEAAGQGKNVDLDHDEVQEMVKDAVKEAVREVVASVMEESAQKTEAAK